jgi:Phage ABA sandwich domain
MNKTEVIARRILGWKLNRWDRWYDPEKEVFIYDFQPKKNLDQAQLIVDRLKSFGYTYQEKRKFEVCFNDVCETGKSLPEAITNAAFSIADNSTIPEEWL